MTSSNQLGFADSLLSRRQKVSKMAKNLHQLDQIIDWKSIVEAVTIIDQTDSRKGGRPRKNPQWMIKAIFLQHLFNLSDPQLEDQLIDRLSFQRFIGINLDQEIPVFTTFWRFKEALIENGLDEKIFTLINKQLDTHELFVKKGTIVDATIISSANRPLSRQKREVLKSEPNPQIDTDARATKKNGRWYYGYKGHIGVDVESKLIRKATFTPANEHDSKQTKQLVSYDEGALFGDKAYYNDDHKFSARNKEWFYGVLEKKPKNGVLSTKQKKRNAKMSKIRAHVEHPLDGYKARQT